MTVDKRPGVTHRERKPSSNEIQGGPGGRIPSTTPNPSKEPPRIPSQGPAPRQPYGH